MTDGAKGGGLAVWAYLACGGLAIGSFGPWAGGFFSYEGIGNNGSLTLLAAGLAAVAIWRWTATRHRSAAVATLLLGALCAAIGVYDLLEVRDDPAGGNEWAWSDGVGWGLALVLAVSSALVLLSISMYRRSRAGSRLELSGKQRMLLAGIGLVFLIGLSTVVSSKPQRSGSESLFLKGPGDRLDAREADEKILAVRPGTPAQTVMARLGPPEAVLVIEEESIFYYGAWQLVLGERGLRARTKYPGPEVDLDIDLWAHDRELQRIYRKARRLRPGTSIEAVKAKLGRPEGIEAYGSSLQRDVGLWYGEWRLVFVGRKFDGMYR